MKNTGVVAAFIVGFGTLVLSAAAAQTNNQPMPMMGMMGGGCPTMGMMGHGRMGRGMMGNHSKMGAMVAGRLAYLKSELNITDAQSEAWEGYADAVTSRVQTMKGMRQNMHAVMQNGGAIERMEARIATMETMVEAMKAVSPATKELYSNLSEEQRKIADNLIGMDCGAM